MYSKIVIGLGCASTKAYLGLLNKLYQEEKGGYSTFPCLLMNINFNQINPYLPNQFKHLIPEMEKIVDMAMSYKAKSVLVPNITLHQTLDQLNLPFKIVHPVREVAKKLIKLGVKETYLFATPYTMNNGYVSSILSDYGIDVMIPNKDHQEVIDEYRKAVYKDNVTSELLTIYKLLLKNYSAKHHVVLGCTELSVKPPYSSAKILDMTQIQCQEFIKL